MLFLNLTRNRSIKFSLLTGALMLCVSFNSLSAKQNKPIQSTESIEQSARNFALSLAFAEGTDDNIQVDVGKLDKRLRLAKCSKPLTAFKSPNTKPVGRTTVGVRCRGDKSWKLYVPVNIKVTKMIATIKHPVPKNTMLQESDIELVKMDVTPLHNGYYTSKKAVSGKFIKMPMRAGSVLTPAHITNPLAIKKGNVVTILADLGDIQVRMKGKALKSGSLGDWVPVQNLSSNRKVEGRITGTGVIQVTL